MKRLSHKNPNEHNDIDGEGSWAVSYGDMITLLLSFFLLFFSVDAHKTQEDRLTTSLLAALSPVAKGDTKQGAGLGDTAAIDQSLSKALGASVSKIGNRIVLEFPGVSFFESGSIDLTAEGRATLKAFTNVYTPFAGHNVVTIVGFSDERKVSAKHRYKDNLELSVLRAVAAQRQLQNLGIPIAQTRLSGHGVKRLESEKGEDTSEKTFALARKITLIIEPERGVL